MLHLLLQRHIYNNVTNFSTPDDTHFDNNCIVRDARGQNMLNVQLTSIIYGFGSNALPSIKLIQNIDLLDQVKLYYQWFRFQICNYTIILNTCIC